MVILEVKNAVKWYRPGLFPGSGTRVKALDNVSLSVSRGESLGIIGESGGGKSTLARIMIGLEQPDDGQVLYCGKRLEELSKDEKADFRRDVQIVFQDTAGAFNPRMRVISIMKEPLENYYPGQKKSYLIRMKRLLELVGLHPDILGSYPHQLSGGQRQRLAIARALVSQPKLLLCDEVIASLDISLQGQILMLLRKLQQSGLTIFFISHQLPPACYLADIIAVMCAGRIVEMLPREKLSVAQHPYSRSLLASWPI
ncbi:ABC transporter ATP-binding protein [Sporomusa sp. GT1]|uniref:ABC transporter ATP-binding protein n=1 Tax=Sporomusa sp. GT1 TaxID=1534747 RepID=UPI001666BF15|nr:dipeptide/oligopeptide/nickel ABC transporter ATP-binding protein [Sporomusa sp. GT1]